MIKHLLVPGLAIGTLILSTGQALAGGFAIDTFNEPIGGITQQILLGTDFGNSGMSTVSGLSNSETIGGSRFLMGELVPGSDFTRRRAADITVIGKVPMMPDTGLLNINNRFNTVQNKTTLIWDNNGMGLGAQGQFLDRLGTSSGLAIKAFLVDSTTEFTFNLMDEFGEMASVTKTGFQSDEVGLFKLEEFLADNMDINLNAIKSVGLNVAGEPGANTQLDLVQGLELPEPSMVLGSLCMLGLGLLTKKRPSKDD